MVPLAVTPACCASWREIQNPIRLRSGNVKTRFNRNGLKCISLRKPVRNYSNKGNWAAYNKRKPGNMLGYIRGREQTKTQTNIGGPSKPTEKNIKLEMETFGDLAPFLHSANLNLKSNPVDELNTPIFDRKGPFTFMTNNSTQNIAPQLSTTSEDNLKFEYDVFDNSAFSNIKHLQNNSDISVNSNHNNNNLNAMNVRQQENNSATIDNILQYSKANYISPSESDYRDMFIFNNNNNNETPINIQLNGDQLTNNNNNHNNKYEYIFEDNSSIVSVNSNVSSPNSDLKQGSIGTGLIDDSNSCTSSELSIQKLPKLKLNLGFEFSQTLNIPNTPEVINSLVSFESDKFNIFDFTDEKNITTVNAEDIRFEIPTTSSSLIEDDNKSRSLKRKGKIKKRYEDDDEDYLPPSEELHYNNSDDSDNESEILTKRTKRTSKRSLSISSDDAVKYRELRDKNNEASRKSRLKRKCKELTLVKEMEQLEEKNIKLKAQVNELDKMVGNFRNNLFKIMLQK